MKDQNTPTNTLEYRLKEILDELWDDDGVWYTGKGSVPAEKALLILVKEELSQAVNKAEKEAEYWRKRASKWKKEVEKLDGKLMNYELSKTNTHMEGNKRVKVDETPKGDK